MGPGFSVSSPILVVSFSFDSGHSIGFEVVSHYGFCLPTRHIFTCGLESRNKVEVNNILKL